MDERELVELLNLRPLEPEGGYFAETWRSEETLPASGLPSRYKGDRCLGTAIYYLLTAQSMSRMHRLQSDEVFHFYLGDPVEMLVLHPEGRSERIVLGADLLAGQRPQFIVPRGAWQGARLLSGGRFALLGTTVSPGFEYTDFELGGEHDLVAGWPDQASLIRALI